MGKRNRALDILNQEDTSEVKPNRALDALNAVDTNDKPKRNRALDLLNDVEPEKPPTDLLTAPQPALNLGVEPTAEVPKEMVEKMPNPMGKVFETGLQVLNQFNRPYSAISGMVESGIKELTTPSTKEDIASSPYPNRILERIGGTAKAAVKGGWESLLSNDKGATDPLKAAVEQVRGPESKMTGEPGVLGTAKDLLSAEGLETIRPLTDVTGALAGGDPLMHVKSVLPLSVTKKGTEATKWFGEIPGSYLDQLAEGERGFAAYKEGGKVEKATDYLNDMVIKPAAKAAVEAIDGIDQLPESRWGNLLKGTKEAVNKVKAGFSDAIFNRTGDKLKDGITETYLKHMKRSRSIMDEYMTKYLKDKEAIMLGGSAPSTENAANKLLNEGLERAEFPTNINKPTTPVPTSQLGQTDNTLSGNAVYDYTQLAQNKFRVKSQQIGKALSAGIINEAEAQSFMDDIAKQLDIDATHASNYDPISLSAKVDRDAFDIMSREEALGKSFAGDGPLDFLAKTNERNRTLTSNELRRINETELFPTGLPTDAFGLQIDEFKYLTKDGKFITATPKDDAFTVMERAAKENRPFSEDELFDFEKRTATVDDIRELFLGRVKDYIVDEGGELYPEFQHLKDALDDYNLQAGFALGSEGNVMVDRMVREGMFKPLYDKIKLYADNDMLPSISKVVSGQNQRDMEYVIHSLTPEARNVLETKTGGALGSGNRNWQGMLVDPKHASNISRTYVDTKGNDLPLGFINMVNRYKDDIMKSMAMGGPELPQLVKYNAEVLGLESDLPVLAQKLKNIYGDFKGNIFDTDPVRAMLTRTTRFAKAKSANEFFESIRSMANKGEDNRLIIAGADADIPKGMIRTGRKELDDIAGTPEIIERINKTFDKITDKGDEQVLYDIYNEAMQLWKQSATTGIGIPRFGFTASNIASELGKNLQAGVTEAQPYLDAIKVLTFERGNSPMSLKPGLFKDSMIELPGQGGRISYNGKGINAISTKPNTLGMVDNSSNSFNASELLAMMKELGVVDAGFAGQDLGRLLESNPEFGKMFINLVEPMTMFGDTKKVLGTQFKDYFARNKSLPKTVDSWTVNHLPPELKQFYVSEALTPKATELAQQGQIAVPYKLVDEPRLRNYDFTKKLVNDAFPDAGKLGEQIAKTVEPGEKLNKWQRMLDAVKSPVKTLAKGIEGKFPKVAAGLEGFSAVMSSGQDLAKWSENTARAANFIDKLKKGYKPDAAAKLVEKFSFNYADRSDMLDKARQLFPFATFAWKNVPLQIEQALTNQKPFAVTAQTINAMNSEPETQKDLASSQDFTRNSLPVKVPDVIAELLGMKKEGQNTYIPVERFLPMTQVLNKGFGDPGKIAEGIIGSTGPWKALFETALNKNVSTGRPIDTLLTPADTAISRETVPSMIGDIPAKVDYLLRNMVPQFGQASRLMGYEKQPKSVPVRILQALTSLNPINVDRKKNEAIQGMQVEHSFKQLSSELMKAQREGNTQKADQIKKMLNSPDFINLLLQKVK